MADEFLTVDEIAQQLQVVPQTVRNWLNDGKLSYVKVGRRVRVRRSDFDAFTHRESARPGPRPTRSIWDGLPILAHLPDEEK